MKSAYLPILRDCIERSLKTTIESRKEIHKIRSVYECLWICSMNRPMNFIVDEIRWVNFRIKSSTFEGTWSSIWIGFNTELGELQIVAVGSLPLETVVTDY